MKNIGFMLAPAVARLIGIKTGTLAKWRRVGKGPKGSVRFGATTVAYPVAEVERYIAFLNSGSELADY